MTASTAVPPFTCTCGHRSDSATAPFVDGAIPPIVGDVSACINCGQPLIFGEGLILREATRSDIEALSVQTAFDLGRIVGLILRELQRKAARS